MTVHLGAAVASPVRRATGGRWLAAAWLALLPALPAHAVFPGANGKIVFASTRDGNQEIYVMLAGGTNPTRLTNNSANDYDPVWSPDGTKIAFVSARDGDSEIFVMNADGSGQTQVTNNLVVDFGPAWSPDGTKIAFYTSRDGNGEIYVMNANGSGQVNLTNHPSFDEMAAWSPDGTRIAFRSHRDGNIEVYVMEADGDFPTRLTNNAANDFQPAWSPDGGRIAFTSAREGNDEIYLMNADGSGVVRITVSTGTDGQADWQRSTATPAALVRGFEGTSAADISALTGGFLYPGTPSGAIGTTQYLEGTNGGVAVFDKATGTRLQLTTLAGFWTSAGLPGGAIGDPRVLFDHFTSRWVVSSYGPTANTRQLAISDTSDALGTWKSVRITVVGAGDFTTLGTLSLDEKAVYVTTANFNASGQFTGTSLLSIPKADLFNGAPTLANMTTFTTPLAGADRGAMIQVAASWQANPTGTATVIADSRDSFALVHYQLNEVGAAGATQTAATVIPGSGYTRTTVSFARQPDATRLVALEQGLITANAVQHDGLVLAAHTVRSTLGDFAAVRWTVVDALTGTLRSSGLIQQANQDYYQGTIAINPAGEVVIAYNRSSSVATDGDEDGLPDGNIRLMARTYYLEGDALVETGSELTLRVSGMSDYRCGVRTFVDTTCPRRWGNWAALTVDPTNTRRFYALGSYASQWVPLPGPGSPPLAVWNTYIAEIEPPSSADTDGDGIRDYADNCTLLANPGQCDSDVDGFGNRCDGDLNNNTFTNAQDTTLFRQQLGQPSVGPAFNAADINCNGAVNAQDTTLYRQLLGSPPGPSAVAP